MSVLLYFKSRVGTLYAFEVCKGIWGGRQIIAGLRDPKGGWELAVAADGSEVGPGGEIKQGPGYYTPIDCPEPGPTRLPKSEGPEGFTGTRALYVDPRGTLHSLEGYVGQMGGVDLVATYYGMGSAYFVGVDGRVFCDGSEMYPPGYFTPIPQPQPPRSPERVRDKLVPKLGAVQPTFLQRPDQEDFLKKLLSEGFKRRRDSSLYEIVWRAFGSTGANNNALSEAALTLKEIVTGVWYCRPREWALDWQEITGESLEVHRFAGSGNILEGGYVVFRRADGTHVLEHTYGPEGRDDKEVRPWDEFHVHQMDVPDDVYAELDWVGETDPDRLAAGRDKDPSVRAEEIAIVGDEHGWMEIDHQPLMLTGKELRLRWEDEDWDEETAENAKNMVSSGNYDIEAVPAALYDILTLCEQTGNDFDAYVAEARKLRRLTKDTDALRRSDAELDAGLIRDRLNVVPPSVLHREGVTLLVRVGLDEEERIVLDPADRTWKVKPFE